MPPVTNHTGLKEMLEDSAGRTLLVLPGEGRVMPRPMARPLTTTAGALPSTSSARIPDTHPLGTAQGGGATRLRTAVGGKGPTEPVALGEGITHGSPTKVRQYIDMQKRLPSALG